MKYPLSCDTWGQEELDAIQRVVDSGRFTMGPEVEKFEKQFAEFFGVRHAKMVNSGSSANLLMMQSLRYSTDYPIRPLDGVIVPAVSWSTTFYPVCQAGFQLIFADVDKDTLNICPKSVRKILENNPDCARAILAVNLLGNPADLYELRQIANEYDLILLEDNCESLGSYLPDGEYCGTYGDIGTFSFVTRFELY
jgi:CDP-6-deoxy-D-xylo-4-hexulose-3-dehydrase